MVHAKHRTWWCASSHNEVGPACRSCRDQGSRPNHQKRRSVSLRRSFRAPQVRSSHSRPDIVKTLLLFSPTVRLLCRRQAACASQRPYQQRFLSQCCKRKRHRKAPDTARGDKEEIWNLATRRLKPNSTHPHRTAHRDSHPDHLLAVQLQSHRDNEAITQPRYHSDTLCAECAGRRATHCNIASHRPRSAHRLALLYIPQSLSQPRSHPNQHSHTATQTQWAGSLISLAARRAARHRAPVTHAHHMPARLTRAPRATTLRHRDTSARRAMAILHTCTASYATS